MNLPIARGLRGLIYVLWELSQGERTFRALREACEQVSPSVLNDRLAELRELGLVELGEAGYQLSKDGSSLGELLLPLDAWARRWAARRG